MRHSKQLSNSLSCRETNASHQASSLMDCHGLDWSSQPTCKGSAQTFLPSLPLTDQCCFRESPHARWREGCAVWPHSCLRLLCWPCLSRQTWWVTQSLKHHLPQSLVSRWIRKTRTCRSVRRSSSSTCLWFLWSCNFPCSMDLDWSLKLWTWLCRGSLFAPIALQTACPSHLLVHRSHWLSLWFSLSMMSAFHLPWRFICAWKASFDSAESFWKCSGPARGKLPYQQPQLDSEFQFLASFC